MPVETGAASVNPVDVSFREGAYPTDLPATAGLDVAGVVIVAVAHRTDSVLLAMVAGVGVLLTVRRAPL
ncbi:alcohol dehydrogenase catalytic domain-containing protein [Salinigranum salinum]|uniref:alcohol dehydrogenase catalytic domain-containing protein n=1 Tax=Salinigranum salinum TaxID=1364937 RepID=UPI001260C14D|nr:hypothetical protein [Salinigranum salinum]